MAPAAAPGWTPQGAPPAAWQGPGPGAGRQRGRGPIILLLLLVLVAAAAAAYVVLAKPFGGGPGPSSSPGALVLPTARPAVSLVPTPEPTASVVAPSDAPSDGPTLQPTSEPTPETPLPSVAETATCRSETAHITVTYPASWQTYTGDPRWDCLLFDPEPITVLPDTELPPVAVGIYPDTRAFATVQVDFTTTSVYTVLQTESGTVGDHDAVAYELENTGEGFYEKGVRQTVVVIDLGDPGCLVMETVGTPGARYDANVEVLVQMVGALQID
ncbi:MAG: hypothetical protein ACYC65_07245 [Candidatus Limnocylindrales bacterium]